MFLKATLCVHRRLLEQFRAFLMKSKRSPSWWNWTLQKFLRSSNNFPAKKATKQNIIWTFTYLANIKQLWRIETKCTKRLTDGDPLRDQQPVNLFQLFLQVFIHKGKEGHPSPCPSCCHHLDHGLTKKRKKVFYLFIY